MGWTFSCAIVCVSLLAADPVQDRDTLVRNDREQYGRTETWIYNDLAEGLQEAKREKKPVLVVFRCIPCEACKKFDEDVAGRDEAVRDLMDRFVCVRIIQANRMDLTRFRHDFDQSFAVYSLDDDGRILGRYGTRSARAESNDMDLLGFRAALEGALELFQAGDSVRESLAGKAVPDDGLRTPDDFPRIAGKFPEQLDYQGSVAKSCLHCHQVAEATRTLYRDRKEPIPDHVLFPYPDPTVLGLTMSPKERALILSVDPTSSAARDGYKPGDRIMRLDGQPLVSVADIQWVLHEAKAPAVLVADIEREGQAMTLPMTLEEGFRTRGDLSWRASSWDLRRMALGGMRLDEMLNAERRQLGIPTDKLALRVRHVGQYGDHAVARDAGVKASDVLVSYAGDDRRRRETDLLAEAVQEHKPGDMIPLKLLRDGKEVEVSIRLQ